MTKTLQEAAESLRIIDLQCAAMPQWGVPHYMQTPVPYHMVAMMKLLEEWHARHPNMTLREALDNPLFRNAAAEAHIFTVN